MRFAQGKLFVYMRRDDGSRVIAEWPNGVIQERIIADCAAIRRWPDGRVEHFGAGDPAS